MRRLVLLFMILLLPLRGWAGAVMSVDLKLERPVQFAAAGLVAGISVHPKAGSSHDAKVLTKVGADKCPGHSAKVDTVETAAEGDGHGNTCTSCQICHTVAMAGAALVTAIPPSNFSLITTRSVHFTSATLSGGFKPPIS